MSYYWYTRNLKKCGFVPNIKQEFTVIITIVKAEEILDNVVLLYQDGEEIALLASIHHKPHMWTIHTFDLGMAICDCRLGLGNDLCKHTMKVFKMLHPKI